MYLVVFIQWQGPPFPHRIQIACAKKYFYMKHLLQLDFLDILFCTCTHKYLILKYSRDKMQLKALEEIK